MRKIFLNTLRKLFSKLGPLGWNQKFPDNAHICMTINILHSFDGLVLILEWMVALPLRETGKKKMTWWIMWSSVGWRIESRNLQSRYIVNICSNQRSADPGTHWDAGADLCSWHQVRFWLTLPSLMIHVHYLYHGMSRPSLGTET